MKNIKYIIFAVLLVVNAMGSTMVAATAAAAAPATTVEQTGSIKSRLKAGVKSIMKHPATEVAALVVDGLAMGGVLYCLDKGFTWPYFVGACMAGVAARVAYLETLYEKPKESGEASPNQTRTQKLMQCIKSHPDFTRAVIPALGACAGKLYMAFWPIPFGIII